MESRERPTRVDLRARKQGERQSGRGFPKIPDKSIELSGERGLTRLFKLKERLNQLKAAREFLPTILTITGTLATLRAIGEADFPKIISTSELGPTPRVAPTPGDITKEMEKFGATIEAINQGPGVASTPATPTASEIQPKVNTSQSKETIDFVGGSIGGAQFVSEKEYFAKFPASISYHFEEIYDEYGGKERLGFPISRQIGEIYEPNGVLQFFSRSVLAFGFRDESYPGMELTIDSVERGRKEGYKELMLVPIGWHLYNDYLQRERPLPNEPGWVNPNDFQIDSRVKDFYEKNGGVSHLGIPISEPIELSPGKFIQWTTLTRIEFTEDGQAQLSSLGKDYYQLQIEANPEYGDYALFPCFPYNPEKVNKIDPVLSRELQQRTQELMVWLSKNMGQDFYSIQKDRTNSYRDWLIYIYHNGGIFENLMPEFVLAPSPERIYSTLALHEFLIRDSFIPQIAKELEQPMGSINRMLKENLDPRLFYNGVVPQIPATAEEIVNSVVLARGDIAGRYGLGYGDFSVLFGRYWLPGYSYKEAKKIFGDFFAHEKGHSSLQAYRSPQLEDLDWFSPEGYYVHELHYILVNMVGRMLGYSESGLPPRLGYVYGHLIEEGYEPQKAFKILLNSLASGSCLYPEREVIKSVYSKDYFDRLPPETQRDIEEINSKYGKELVDLFMKYSR